VDGGQALEEVTRFVGLGARPSGSEGAARAAQHLHRRLERLHLQPVTDEFTALTPQGDLVFRNVVGVLEGTGPQTIVLASHYDTKAGLGEHFVGANDSGSSTGLLLELARVLAQHRRLPVTLLFAFLDGEECLKQYGPNDGLHGSRHMARTLVRNQRARNVVAVIVLDMIGDRDLTVTIPRNGSRHLMSMVLDAAHEEGVRLKFSLARGTILDDHVPFLEAGMPAVDLIDFEFGSSRGRNDYWHTTEDTLDKLSADSLQIVGRVVVRVINKLITTPASSNP